MNDDCLEEFQYTAIPADAVPPDVKQELEAIAKRHRIAECWNLEGMYRFMDGCYFRREKQSIYVSAY